MAFIRQNEILDIAGTYLYLLLGMKDEAIRNIEAGKAQIPGKIEEIYRAVTSLGRR